MTDNCRTTEDHIADCTEKFWNKGQTIWTVDEAKSLECFNKEQYCFVDEAFADEETATKYLSDRFGGVLYNPANIPTVINPG
jgi:hypothetical protein